MDAVQYLIAHMEAIVGREKAKDALLKLLECLELSADKKAIRVKEESWLFKARLEAGLDPNGDTQG